MNALFRANDLSHKNQKKSKVKFTNPVKKFLG